MLKQKAIKIYGTPSALARALGVTKSAVSQWGETIPERHALKIRYELKPKLFKKSAA